MPVEAVQDAQDVQDVQDVQVTWHKLLAISVLSILFCAGIAHAVVLL